MRKEFCYFCGKKLTWVETASRYDQYTGRLKELAFKAECCGTPWFHWVEKEPPPKSAPWWKIWSNA